MLTHWPTMLFIAAVVVGAVVAEQFYGPNARLVALAVGIAGGTWIYRRLG